jgi:hypothetical protein
LPHVDGRRDRAPGYRRYSRVARLLGESRQLIGENVVILPFCRSVHPMPS